MFLFLLSFLFLTVNSAPIESVHGLQIPLKYHVIPKDVLIANQQKRLAKWDRKSKFLQGPYKTDYVTIDVAVGTPIQNFTLMLSTGSIRTWVFKEGADGASTNSKFFSNSSTTLKWLRRKFQQFDGSFNVSADWYTDVLHVHGHRLNIQAFGVAESANDDHDVLFPVDGVLGLGYLPSSSYKDACKGEPTSVISNLMKKAPQGFKTYTIYLNPNLVPGQAHLSGSITFGEENKNCDGEYESYPLSSAAQYGSDTIYSTSAAGYVDGYVDLDISSVMFPASAAQKIYELTNTTNNFHLDTGLYIIKCDQKTSFQHIRIVGAGGKDFIIYKEHFIVDIGLGDGNCVLALEMSDFGYSNDVFVFGIPLFRRYCVKVDTENNILSLLNQK
ncbi:hypothetical protein M3Y97_01133700 [Aphelenchoides bicaudatus]|nr:hypothetical protein M3Y97_01133700 [Aphelenchoides bicaudatus]